MANLSKDTKSSSAGAKIGGKMLKIILQNHPIKQKKIKQHVLLLFLSKPSIQQKKYDPRKDLWFSLAPNSPL